MRGARRLPAAGSKQLHVFQGYVLQHIPGIAPSFVLSPSCSRYKPLKREKQFVGPKYGEWEDVKTERGVERAKYHWLVLSPVPKQVSEADVPLGATGYPCRHDFSAVLTHLLACGLKNF